MSSRSPSARSVSVPPSPAAAARLSPSTASPSFTSTISSTPVKLNSTQEAAIYRSVRDLAQRSHGKQTEAAITAVVAKEAAEKFGVPVTSEDVERAIRRAKAKRSRLQEEESKYQEKVKVLEEKKSNAKTRTALLAAEEELKHLGLSPTRSLSETSQIKLAAVEALMQSRDQGKRKTGERTQAKSSDKQLLAVPLDVPDLSGTQGGEKEEKEKENRDPSGKITRREMVLKMCGARKKAAEELQQEAIERRACLKQLSNYIPESLKQSDRIATALEKLVAATVTRSSSPANSLSCDLASIELEEKYS